MKSRNSRALDADELAHLADVKSLPCACCHAAPPSLAHHIVQGDHFTTIPLCEECHVGRTGIHREQTAFRLRHLTEMGCLNWTYRKLRFGTERTEKRTERSRLSSSKIIPHRSKAA